jgi:hypothetical protein
MNNRDGTLVTNYSQVLKHRFQHVVLVYEVNDALEMVQQTGI